MSRYRNTWRTHQQNNRDNTSHKSGSIGAVAADLASFVNWPSALVTMYWLTRKINQTRSLDFAIIPVTFSDSLSPAELSGVWGSIGIDHCVIWSSNNAFHFLVSKNQKKWAEESAGRYLAGNPPKPWSGQQASPNSLTYHLS